MNRSIQILRPLLAESEWRRETLSDRNRKSEWSRRIAAISPAVLPVQNGTGEKQQIYNYSSLLIDCDPSAAKSLRLKSAAHRLQSSR